MGRAERRCVTKAAVRLPEASRAGIACLTAFVRRAFEAVRPQPLLREAPPLGHSYGRVPGILHPRSALGSKFFTNWSSWAEPFSEGGKAPCAVSNRPSDDTRGCSLSKGRRREMSSAPREAPTPSKRLESARGGPSASPARDQKGTSSSSKEVGLGSSCRRGGALRGAISSSESERPREGAA